MAKALIHLILRTGINEKSENRDERKFSMNQKLKEKIQESLSSVLPITVIVLLLGTFIVPIHASTITLFLAGAFLLVIGMGMFQLGAEMALSQP